MRAAYATDGPRKRTRHTCIYAHGCETVKGDDRGSKRAGTRGGVKRWRDLCSEEGGSFVNI